MQININSNIELFNIRQTKNNGGTGNVFFLRDDRGYAGSNTGTTFKIESWKGNGQEGGTLANFVTINDGFEMSRFFINNNNGNVGIGTTNPGSFKLAVEGKIGAREVQVTATNPWPDFVFKEGYALKSLAEVESFIQVNKHLPEVPSAKEVEANGINLGKMDALLLKKIEELTLYMIEMKKENQSLKDRIEVLEK